tara:strand:+ start:141 stop:1085 length:945 start_codon:yes stop_codon:yes gene_type:complete
MKTFIPFTIAAALAASGLANAQAFSQPSGYYQFDGKAGGNIFIPAFVNPSVASGAITGSNATTLTLPASTLTPNALNAGAAFPTHYVEFTSGPNAGVVVDIESNTATTITLDADILALGLVNNEAISIRPHVTLRSVLASSESSLAGFTDSATFYLSNGVAVSYFYIDATTGWSSDFSTPDGNNQPVPPGTGFVLFLNSAAPLTVTGEVKASPTVVQLTSGVVNIVGLVNPLVGSSVDLDTTGFEDLAAFADSITVYEPGPLVNSVSYFPLGDGTLSTDFSTPTTDQIANTTGAVVIPSVTSSVKLSPGFTISQ